MNIDDSRIEARPVPTDEQWDRWHRIVSDLAPDLLPMLFEAEGEGS